MQTLQETSLKVTAPQNLEAEQAVLGAVLWHNDAVYSALEKVNADEFYSPAHRKIFAAMVRLATTSVPIDELTIAEALTRDGVLKEVGGAAYLAELSGTVASAGNIQHHAQIVHEKYVLRQLLAASQEISTSCSEGVDSAADLLDEAQKRLFSLAESQVTGGFRGMNPLVKEAFKNIEVMHDRGNELLGVATGFDGLDRKLLGLQRSDLIVLAARPAMGKTAFALNIAANAAIRYGARVGLFSLEMSSLQLTLRMLCAEAQVDAQLMRSGRLHEEYWQQITNAAGRLSEARIYIDDAPTLTPMQMRARARRMKAEHGCDLVIVDYLQLMHVAGKVERRDLEIGEISRSLKALAKELDVPVLALAQLSRRVEERKDGPKLSDLRESGAIEQDADIVLFLHRDPDKAHEEDEAWPTEIQIGKHRNGPVGMVEVMFERRFARFFAEDHHFG
jgi:replicative DNA helicase